MILCYASSHRGGQRRRDALVIGRSAAEQGELVEIDVNRCRLFVKQKKKKERKELSCGSLAAIRCALRGKPGNGVGLIVHVGDELSVRGKAGQVSRKERRSCTIPCP